MGISAVLITLDEERNIEECLNALSFVDEIVVLDSGSTDRTLEIARGYTDKIATREFRGFSEQRTAAMEMATQEWVLVIDPDEIVSEQLAAEMLEASRSDDLDGYRMPRSTYFLGKMMRHCGWYPDYQLRLVRKSRVRFPYRLVHEAVVVDGRCGLLQNPLVHYSYRTMDDWARKALHYCRAAAVQKFNEGRRCRLVDLLFNPGFNFFKMYVIKQGFRDGLHGFVLCALTACSAFVRYVMLWEMSIRGVGEKEPVSDFRSS